MAGVGVGAALSYLGDRRLWRRSQALAARLLLAETFVHVWDETGWDEVELHLERLRAHLDSLGVSSERLDALLLEIRRCRASIAAQREKNTFDPKYGPRLTSEELNGYRQAVDAIVSELKR